MSFHSNEPLKDIIHYEQQLNSVMQKIQNLILDPNPSHQHLLTELLTEENELIKILEVQSTRLSSQSKQIYARNLVRYKKKNKEHSEYVYMQYGQNALPRSNAGFDGIMQYQRQNIQLAADKMLMYQNQRTQNNMGQQLQYQGERLQADIHKNRDIRQQASHSQNAIHLIQLSILRRKLMFGSLVLFFVIALIIVIVVKANKKG